MKIIITINNRDVIRFLTGICYILIFNLLFISHNCNIGVDLNNNNSNKLEQKTYSTQTCVIKL